MAANIAGIFEEKLAAEILKSKVLLVGAGGIGCEILKNLVLSGFQYIEVIDLDTIDISNLNRQFLFHREHVGLSKAAVARTSALSFNPNVVINAHHASITGQSYNVPFFEQFNIVLNALDNRQARNYVNRLCLYAKVPLIESGTAGYDGQVELILRGKTQCYECTPKPTQKTFPGCTIRNTPSELIHCVVWGKHLFNQLFGEFDADQDVSPDASDPESKTKTEDYDMNRVSTRKWAEECNYEAGKIFTKLFNEDIHYLLSMEDLWKERTPPTPLTFSDYMGTDSGEAEISGTNETMSYQKVWTLKECVMVFAKSIKGIAKTFESNNSEPLEWDKDDKDAMDFVTACANIRAHIFKIEPKSRFEIKSMAGNIIAAIATTNAITAGVVVFKAFKVLRQQYEQCQSVYMRLRPNPRNQLLVVEKDLIPPNPKCMVCSEKPSAVLTVDVDKMTIGQLRDEVLIKTLCVLEPDVSIDSLCKIVISSEPDEIADNDNNVLSSASIVDGCILSIDDFGQDYKLSLTVKHRPSERDTDLFEISNDDSVKLQQAKLEQQAKPNVVESDPEDMCIVTPVDNESKKRKEPSSSQELGEPSSKRQKVYVEDDEDLLIIEDD